MYDGAMKHLMFLAAVALSAFGQAVPTVFVLPMPSGFDQYLAVHLTGSSNYRVVTDPAQATLILADRIGERLEQTLKDIAAPPPARDDTTAENFTSPRMAPLSQSRGTLFLVDRASHQVLWSTFHEPKTSQPKALNEAARRIVESMAAARK